MWRVRTYRTLDAPLGDPNIERFVATILVDGEREFASAQAWTKTERELATFDIENEHARRAWMKLIEAIPDAVL